jgi:hypothetical protein
VGEWVSGGRACVGRGVEWEEGDGSGMDQTLASDATAHLGVLGQVAPDESIGGASAHQTCVRSMRCRSPVAASSTNMLDLVVLSWAREVRGRGLDDRQLTGRHVRLQYW